VTARQIDPPELRYADELAFLAAADEGPRPPGWRLTPRAVVTFVAGSAGVPVRGRVIEPKFVGERALVERCVVTLAGERGLLLVGEPGTAKSMLSELLAAAICGTSALAVQGTAGTSEDQLRYGWNYALLLAQAVADPHGHADRSRGPRRRDHPLPARGAGRPGLDHVGAPDQRARAGR
jgi:hypothetical protein